MTSLSLAYSPARTLAFTTSAISLGNRLSSLHAPDFLHGFNAQGRSSDWTRQQQVSVILDPDIGLKGAALAAGTD